MDRQKSRRLLIRILKLAYSGELAAAYAYRGHWKSLRDPEERTRIQAIEGEEWHHRRLVGGMLRSMGERPSSWQEAKAVCIGRAAGLLCHLAGWFAPMYGAGRLESRNIKEYENAARYARDCGCQEQVDCLLGMAEVEWEHEKYFRTRVLGHVLSRHVPLWSSPPAKENIRASFLRERTRQASPAGAEIA